MILKGRIEFEGLAGADLVRAAVAVVGVEIAVDLPKAGSSELETVYAEIASARPRDGGLDVSVKLPDDVARPIYMHGTGKVLEG